MKIRKNVIVASMITFCFTATLFMIIPLQAANRLYNPWIDSNDDGSISLQDLVLLANSYGTSGTPLTKAGLLFDSGWMNITDRQGQTISVTHNLNITDWNDPHILVDLSGKIKPDGDLLKKCSASFGMPVCNVTFGGPLMEVGMALVQTNDGGFIIGAVNGTSWTAEDFDIMLIKLDAFGNQQWNTTFVSPGYDEVRSIIQTTDGGYALAGTKNYYGPGDMWLIKTDALGNTQWNKTYGGPNFEGAVGVIQTNDGGYALAGETGVFSSYYNGFLVKTDADGNMQWNQTYNGGTWSNLFGMIQRGDGGYTLAGTKSLARFWLIKTDSNGSVLWDKDYGGSGDQEPYGGIVQTIDGGYAMAGYTTSYGAGGRDGWLIKIDADGKAQWNVSFGGPYRDECLGFVQTADAGFALTGMIGNTDPSTGDAMLVKTDSKGNVEWTRTYGGSNIDIMRSRVILTNDGVAMVGETSSFGAGDKDVWFIRTCLETGLEQVNAAANTLTLYRGPTDPYWNYVRVQIWLRKTP